MYVILFRFKNSRLLLNHSWTSARMSFNLVANSIGLELVTMRLVSSAYNTNLAFLAVTSGRSFIYNNKSKGPRIEPCGMPCLTNSQFE